MRSRADLPYQCDPGAFHGHIRTGAHGYAHLGLSQGRSVIVIYFLIRRWSARQPANPESRFGENQPSEYQERLEKELKLFGEEL